MRNSILLHLAPHGTQAAEAVEVGQGAERPQEWDRWGGAEQYYVQNAEIDYATDVVVTDAATDAAN